MKIRISSLSMFVILVLLVTGCGGNKKANVSGKITYKNEPLKGGIIYMIDDAGANHSSPIQDDGSYTVTDVMPGSYSVTIETESINPDNKGKGPTEVKGGQNAGMVGKNAKMQGEYAKQMGMTGGGSDGPGRDVLIKRYVKIPAKYAAKATSNLKVDVLSGPTVKDFPLTD